MDSLYRPYHKVIGQIIKFATDNTSLLRYPTGQDAEEFLFKEKIELNDEEFVKKMAQRFSLHIN
jgi:hypothetical protein